jgi:protocatechuate 3,4-dioxygenase beta subunit
MNRRTGTAAFVVIAVAGALAWWALRDAGPATSTLGHQQTVVATGGGPRAPGRSAEANGPAPGADTVYYDDDPVGTLLLEGQVIDGSDKPVVGATVVLESNPPRTATTDESGAFAFERLVGRSYTLIARATGGVAGPISVRLTSAMKEPVIMQLRPAGSVEVTVTGPGGAVAPGATVELRGPDRQTATTGADGIATFGVVMPGGYQVLAEAPTLARSVTQARVGAQGVTQVALVLRPGAAVSGRVVAAGQPVAGARVIYVGASDWGTSGDDQFDAVITGGDGGFRFEALPPGSFRFVARHPPHAPGSSPIVMLDGTTAKGGVEIELAPGAVVRGTVRDGSGNAVAAARVRIGIESRTPFGDGPRQAYTDDRGAFAITGLPRKPLVAVAMHEAGSSATVPVDTTGGDVDKVELRLDHTGQIAGTVVDPAGEPLEGVQVSAGPDFGASDRSQWQQWRLRGFPQELTESGGRFTLTGLAPGSYKVRASRARAAARGRQWAAEGVVATTGTTDLRIVLAPEGAVKGKVAFADGTVPGAFVVSVGFSQESFVGGDGSFMVDGLAPGVTRLSVRGPSFDSRGHEVTIESAKTIDAGTITVSKGRTIAGVVTANGQPVEGAVVYAGRQIFGSGSSGKAQQMGPFQRGTKDTTTDAAGKFSIAGFGPGDLAVVAEHPDRGRSKALRLVAGDPSAGTLTLALEPFGALSGKLMQGGSPAEGVIVSAQATTTPGALFNVASGPDGSYRFDKLAPEVYKVSATLGMPMMGMKFYSKQVTVVSGKDTVVDLAIEQGAVSLAVTPTPKTGAVGVASVTIVSGVIAATSARDLQLRLAAAGAGSSQWAILVNGGAATFSDMVPGNYTACAVPFPSEVQGMAAMGYVDRNGDRLPVYCKQVVVAPQPAQQAVEVPVEIPPFVPEEPPS